MKPKAVVLLSGGMDSCVTLACLVRDGYDPAALHVTYCHRTAQREAQAFKQITDFYKIEERLVVSIDYLSRIGGSALTDSSVAVPEQLSDRNTIPVTYVPFRNGNLLAIAVSWAEVLQAAAIYWGAVYEDSSGYPDTRPDFVRAFERAANLGTRPETKIEIVTPLIQLNKGEIVKLGVDLGAPLELTWSCYQREDVACGKCESCRLRLRGFSSAALEDPIPYLEE